jgi:hypothetical protein
MPLLYHVSPFFVLILLVFWGFSRPYLCGLTECSQTTQCWIFKHLPLDVHVVVLGQNHQPRNESQKSIREKNPKIHIGGWRGAPRRAMMKNKLP